MVNWRSLAALGLLISSSLLASCQSQTQPGPEPSAKAKPANKLVELPGIDTSKLTQREKEQWSQAVSDLLAPCSDQPVSLAQCVIEKRACDACEPAAQFLVKQVTAGKTRAMAEAAFRQRFAPDQVTQIEVGSSPSFGPEDAPVTVVEWADFECPFCGMAAPVVEGTVKRFGDQVRFVFKHYPLAMHEHAESAARAAAAADLQGKFWEMHHALFANQKQQDEKGIAKLAKEVGLDMKKFEADKNSERVADAVTADRKQGDKLNLHGTPSIFINGRAFDLENFDLTEDLAQWIELELKLQTGKAPSPAPVAGGAASVQEAGGKSAIAH